MPSTEWNQETKGKLSEKVTQNIFDLGSLAKYVVRSSKSNELLAQAAKNFASQESVVHNSSESLKKMLNMKAQMEFQQAGIEKNLQTLHEIQKILNTVNR